MNMDNNELEILGDSKKNKSPLKFFLDIGICIESPVIEIGESEIIVLDKSKEEMFLSLDTISSISW